MKKNFRPRRDDARQDELLVIAGPPVAELIDCLEADGLTEAEIGDTLIFHALAYLRGRMCPEHFLERAEAIGSFLAECVDETKSDAN